MPPFRAQRRGFSALQRAENSSNRTPCRRALRTGRFQCSSASRKFLKRTDRRLTSSAATVSVLFSEPKIPQIFRPVCEQRVNVEFQCSSASRKFLKERFARHPLDERGFQCSSASRKFLKAVMVRGCNRRRPRFQCSSASRKFLKATAQTATAQRRWFQCSSASRKFLKSVGAQHQRAASGFQCSSASRKFLKIPTHAGDKTKRMFQCSSASRKFLKNARFVHLRAGRRCFSALQRAENSSNNRCHNAGLSFI